MSRPVRGWQADDPSTYQAASPRHRAVRALSALRPVSWAMARVLPHIEWLVSRLTEGQHTLTSAVSGLAVAELTHDRFPQRSTANGTTVGIPGG
jgi:hypothetical protein